MADDPKPDKGEPPPTPDDAPDHADRPAGEGTIGDFVRRAVSAGIEAASRGKEDVVRVATNEMRAWLDRLDLDTEITKALSHMTIEVKAEIRFRPGPDGKLVPETQQETTVRPETKS